mmetsp:Transcript_19779/g.22911  ORF Transcript_19779/g.22911 Transcript_19779/m.22911 type:complete len:242 (+) Transcript_19779:120-845(+)
MMKTGLEIATGGNDYNEKSPRSKSLEESFIDLEKTRIFLKARFDKHKDRVSLDTIRPLPTFLGITGPSFCFAPDAFTPPSKHFDKTTAEKVTQRMSLNFAYFLSNYAMIFVMVFVIITLLHPAMIIYSGIVCFLWKAHNVMVKSNIPLVVMEKDIGKYITVDVRTKILYLITLWVVIAYCFKPFIIVVSLTGLLVLSHAFMRDPKHIESSRHYSDDDSIQSSGDEGGSSGSEVVVNKSDAV